jgi:drug/metabolite transporter (DMT)-like permease
MAVILMTVGSILTTTAYIYANEGKYHPFTTVTIRGVVAMGIMYMISLKQNQDLTFASHHNFKWIFINSLTNLMTALVYAWCQFYLPQPIAIALNSSTPIFIALFDKIIYGVSLNKAQICWLIVTFLGVLMVANGNQIVALIYDRSHEGSSSFENYLSSDPTVMLCVSIILLVVRAIYSYGVMLIKKLKNSSST